MYKTGSKQVTVREAVDIKVVTWDKDGILQVNADSLIEAEFKVWSMFGDEWATSYTALDFKEETIETRFPKGVIGEISADTILTTWFTVQYHGDESAEISSAEWQITGGFEFDDDGAIDVFKSKTKEAFEYASDTPITVFSNHEFLNILNDQ